MLGHNTRLLRTQRKLIDELSILLLNYCVRGDGVITGNPDVYNTSNRRQANTKSKSIAQKHQVERIVQHDDPVKNLQPPANRSRHSSHHPGTR